MKTSDPGFPVKLPPAAQDPASDWGLIFRAVDEWGRLTPHGARSLRQAAVKRTLTVDRLITALGPFDALPAATRRALCSCITNEDRWRMFGRDPAGPRVVTHDVLRWLKSYLDRHDFNRSASAVMAFWELINSAPPRLAYALHHTLLSLNARLKSRPHVRELLSLAGVNPWDLAVSFARGIPQIPRYRGFWHDPDRRITIGVMVGIDMLQSPSGWWLCETNLSPGIHESPNREFPGRSTLYDRDPIVTELLDFTAEHGYRNLIVMPSNSERMDVKMGRQYEEGASDRNIRLRIVEDVWVSRTGYTRDFGVPRGIPDDTLVVRGRVYRTSLDHVLHHKGAVSRALRAYRETSGDSDLLVPWATPDPVMNGVFEDAPYPNLVYKIPSRDSGSGVFFLKANSPDHARTIVENEIRPVQAPVVGRVYSLVENTTGVYQPYVTPVPVSGRLSKVRAHVFLSPAGCRFLEANRMISKFSPPGSLPFGLVKEYQPFLVNSKSTCRLEVVPAEQMESLKRSTLAVARGLAWAAAFGFGLE